MFGFLIATIAFLLVYSIATTAILIADWKRIRKLTDDLFIEKLLRADAEEKGARCSEA